MIGFLCFVIGSVASTNSRGGRQPDIAAYVTEERMNRGTDSCVYRAGCGSLDPDRPEKRPDVLDNPIAFMWGDLEIQQVPDIKCILFTVCSG